MNHLLGNPELNVTDVNDVHKGLNYIVVDSVQYGNQERDDNGKRCRSYHERR